MNHPSPGRGVKTCQNISGNIEHTRKHTTRQPPSIIPSSQASHGHWTRRHGDTHSGCSACLNTRCDDKVCQQYLASAPFQSRGRDTGNLLTMTSRVDSGCCFWRARNEGIQKQGARPGQAATLTRIRSRGRGRADRRGKGPKTSTTRRKIGSHRSLPVPICVSPTPLRPFSGFDIDLVDSSGQATLRIA